VTRPIALLTDFGLRDAYVGVMKAVILGQAPAAQLIDLCHEVPPQDIRRGAFLLATSIPYFPTGTVFLSVVDPGVGTERRALALEAAGWTFVGPDNGLFAWALSFLARAGRLSLDAADGRLRFRVGGRAVELAEPRFWRPQVSSTFHGRDIFAPVAAHLSLGLALDELGPPLDDMLDLPWPEPRRASDGSVRGEVITTDGYGNLVTNLRASDLPPNPVLEISGRVVRGLSPNFQPEGSLVALIGSSDFVELAAPNGSAAATLGAAPGTPIQVRAG
jgi:S-adenosyl-L-methionine hydrolase (adenosine-forming)